MTATIRRLTASDADYALFAGVLARTPPDMFSDFESGDPAELREFDAGFARAGLAWQRYVAQDGSGAAIGAAHYFQIPWLAQPGYYWLGLRVDPAHWRNGVGKGLYQQINAELTALQARCVWAMVREALPAIVELAAREGFRELLRSHPYTLDVAAIPPADPAPFVARMAAHGITVATLRELVPLRPDWPAALHGLHMELTREVPLPEELFTTVDEFRTWVAESPQALPDGYFVAFDGVRPIAQSFLQPLDDEPGGLRQEVTGVLPAYRGMGIAQALKALTIAYAQRAGYHSIHTWVESNNPGMLAINRKWGFSGAPGVILFEKQFVSA